MAKAPVIKTHLVKHMWKAYADKLKKDNPSYIGVRHNKITDFYIYDKDQMAAPRKVPVQYKSTVRGQTVRTRSWKSLVHTSAGLVYCYTQFRKIIETYFRLGRAAIIKGEVIHIKHIGRICPLRVQRDFRKKNQRMINWGATKKLAPKALNPETGKMEITDWSKKVYHTGDDWCRIGWYKQKIANGSLYEFAPAEYNGTTKNSGFKYEFSMALHNDKLLKYQYLYKPIKDVQYED